MHPEMEPIYSKQRLIFRPKSLLLGWWGGGCIPPIPPPKSATDRDDTQTGIWLLIEDQAGRDGSPRKRFHLKFLEPLQTNFMAFKTI